MERLFIPKTEKEDALLQTAKYSPDKKKRRGAIKELRKLNNVPKDDLYSIRVKELYDHIPGKPVGWTRFREAVVFYNDILLKR